MDSLFILATKKGKKISKLILPSNLILLAYMGLLQGNKSDPIIFKFGFIIVVVIFFPI
jgi:hypothetical protein